MGAAHSVSLARATQPEDARWTLPDAVRLESLKSQLEVLDEACKRTSPELDWEDVDTSVLLHSACNTLRNETAILEHNKRSAEPLWRRIVRSTHDPRARSATRGSKGHVHARGGTPLVILTVTFSAEVGRIGAGGSHRDVVDERIPTDEITAVAQQGHIAHCEIDENDVLAHAQAKLEIARDLHFVASTPACRDLHDKTLSVHKDARQGAIVPYQKGKSSFAFCNVLDDIVVVHDTPKCTTTLDTEDFSDMSILPHSWRELCAFSDPPSLESCRELREQANAPLPEKSPSQDSHKLDASEQVI